VEAIAEERAVVLLLKRLRIEIRFLLARLAYEAAAHRTARAVGCEE
jgi:hypothetical protein